MSQSLVKNYLHIIFSTKYRQRLISNAVEDELYAYIGGLCKKMDCQPIKIGGYENHVHILCMLSKMMTLIKLMQEVKSASSRWIKTIHPHLQNFYWQDGYGAFSVNPSETEIVIRYISNQKVHHQKLTFQDEYRAFFGKIWR